MNDYKIWLKHIAKDKLLSSDNLSIKTAIDINDRFFTELEFGTGGLRGKLGLGTNRMNKYVIRRATLGLADTLLNENKKASVAIAYDSRNYSKEFAIEAALTLANVGIMVHLCKELTPTPVLSFMVRYLKCDAGIVITASHNPKEYNGFKVYGKDGGQITLDMANKVLANIKKHDYFETIDEDYDGFVDVNMIKLHHKDVFNAYIASTLKQSVYDSNKKIVKILYTPFNGTGLKYVTAVLKAKGYSYKVIEEQEKPDGNFPTCPKPNPELLETMSFGIKKMQKDNYDILFATDPDADRCGVAVNQSDNPILLTGDEVGLLLLDFLLTVKRKSSKAHIVIKTIATTDLIYRIAKKHNLTVIDTLTGFKFIGEKVGELVNAKRGDEFLIGIEDSCGYLTNLDVRDKDSINAALLIAEMANFYKEKGITLYDRLKQIYKEYGHLSSSLKFIELEGESGKKKIANLMKIYRSDKFFDSFLDCNGKYDYLLQKGFGSKADMSQDVPVSDVLKFYFKDDSELVVRPSGTEPKIKFYYLTPSHNKETLIESKLKNVF